MKTELPATVLGVALCVVLLSGCATPRAAVPRDPLVMPPPPPRVIAPLPEPVPELPTEPQEPVPPLPRVARPAPPRADPKPQTTEPASPPVDPTAPPPTGAPGVPNGAGEPELRKPETPDDARAHQRVRDILARAAGTLNRVDYRALSQPAQQQYDMGKRFMEQSEEALKVRNYTAAVLMAEKAETIASELARR